MTMHIHRREEIYIISIEQGDEYFIKHNMDNRSYSRINGVWKYNTGGDPSNWSNIRNKEKAELLEERFKILQTRFVIVEKAIDFVVGLFPSDAEIESEAEGRYPVNTHNYPNSSPYVQSKASFLFGINWLKHYIQNRNNEQRL